MFDSEHEAKRVLIDRIAQRAVEEGTPLAGQELAALGYSAQEPGPPPIDADESEGRLEKRMAGLLERSYRQQATREGQRPYRDAVAALARGDHYVSWLAELAGIRPSRRARLRRLRQVGLFLFLFAPALLGLLIGAAGLWAALGTPRQTTQDRVGMSVVALVFAGFGAYLLALWRRESRD